MEKLLYDQNQRAYLITGVQLQIDALKKQLGDLYILLAQLDSSLVDENVLPLSASNVAEKPKNAKRPYAPRETKESDKDYFNKVKQVLEVEGKSLTSREILKRIYEYYPDEFDENEDRKNIASLSAILTEKHAEGKIVRDKPEVGHAVFSLPQKVGFEVVVDKKEIKNEITDPFDLDFLDEELLQAQKVDPDDEDLPF